MTFKNISKYVNLGAKLTAVATLAGLSLGFLMSTSSQAIGTPVDTFYTNVEIEVSSQQMPRVPWCDINYLGSSQGYPFTAQSTDVREGCVRTTVVYPIAYLLNTAIAFAFIYLLLIPINRFLIKAK